MKKVLFLIVAAATVLVGAGIPTSLQPDGTTIVSNNAIISCATATTSQLGCVKPDGATININGAGVISASGGSATSVTVGTTTVGGGTSGNFLYDNAGVLGQAVLSRTATGSVSSRTVAAAAADVYNPKDYGALGNGTSTTIGTNYGTSLSAVAAYVTAAGATPFSWMTNSAYGLTFSLATSAAQGSAGTVLPFSVALSGNPSWSQSAPQFNGFNPANQQFLVQPGMIVSGSCIQAGTTVASTAAANNGAKLTSVAQGSTGTTLTFLETVGLVVGQPVVGTSIPSSTTIASLTSTTVTLSASTTAPVAAQAFIQFGEIANVTLSQVTSSACGNGATITFALSNAQVQALTVDYVGLQSAFAAASANGGGQVFAPAGVYEINRPVWNPGITNANTYTPAIVFRGAGMYTTQITPTSDFGAGACAFGESNRSAAVTGYAEWDDFRLVGVGTSNTTGGAVASMDGLCVGAKALVRRVSAWVFNSGLNVLEDHQIIEDSDFSNDFYGIYLASNGGNIGNQRIAKTPTLGNAKAGIATAWNNGLVSATLSDSDTGGNSPYSFYQEAIPYGQTAYAVSLLGYSVIQNMLGENVGNAYIYCEGSATNGCLVNNNTFIGGQPVAQLSSSSSVRVSGLAPRAVVYVGQFLYNNLVNADFSDGTNNFGIVSNGIFEGEFQYNTFGDQTKMLTSLSATIPAMITDNFGFTSGNSIQNTFSMGLSSGEFRVAEASLTAGQILTYGTTYNYVGAIPMLLGYEFQPLGVSLVAASANSLTPVVEKGFAVVNKTTGTAISKGFGACISSATPSSVTACGAGASVSQFTIGGVVIAAASGDTTVSIDVQILFNGGLQPFTVSTLPTANSTLKGAVAYVTDATSPTYNGTLTGGGTVTVPVFCNGSAWVSH